MLPAERYQRILDRLATTGIVSTEELVEQLRVSDETVRRDLRQLEHRGQLVRVHGGAADGRRAARTEAPYRDRSGMATDAKRAIGHAAAALIRPGMTAVIDLGTTALEVARALPADHQGMIATCSLSVAIELSTRDGVEVMVSGGRLRPGDLALSGRTTTGFFGDLHPDIALLGSGGVDDRAGLTDYHFDEIATRQELIENASAAYVLADSTKLGRVATHRVCALNEVTGFIVDQPPPTRLARAITKAGGTVIVAAPAPA